MSYTYDPSSRIPVRELALKYGGMILDGDYRNWAHLGEALGIPKSTLSPYKAVYEAPNMLVDVLPAPNDLSIGLATLWRTYSNKDLQSRTHLHMTINTIQAEKEERLASGATLRSAEDIKKLLEDEMKSLERPPSKIVRSETKQVELSAYSRLERRLVSKLNTASNSATIEISDVEEAILEKIMKALLEIT